MSVEDLFGSDRVSIGKRARALLEERAVGEGHQKTLLHGPVSTILNESWSANGLKTTRIVTYVARQVTSAAIFYPMENTGYNPKQHLLAISLDFSKQPGQVFVSRWHKNLHYDIAAFKQGTFSSFTFDQQSSLKISRAGNNLLWDGWIIPNQGVVLADGSRVKGQIAEEVNEMVIVREGKGSMSTAEFPVSFNLGELGRMILDDDPDKLRQRCFLRYLLTPKKQDRALDSRLLTDHPEGKRCVIVCFNNGWMPQDGDVMRLVRLWDQVQQGRRSEFSLDPLNFKRLGFARWLVAHGRISDDLAN